MLKLTVWPESGLPLMAGKVIVPFALIDGGGKQPGKIRRLEAGEIHQSTHVIPAGGLQESHESIPVDLHPVGRSIELDAVHYETIAKSPVIWRSRDSVVSASGSAPELSL